MTVSTSPLTKIQFLFTRGMRLREAPLMHLAPEGGETPADGAQADGGQAWRATGDDPCFALTPWNPKRTLPWGWVEIRVGIRPVGRARLDPILYYDLGEGESERTAIKLSLAGDGVRDLVYLPRGTRRLRFDPMGTRGDFELGEIRLERLGFLRGTLRQARAALGLLPPRERRPGALLARARRAGSRGEAWRRFVASTRPSQVSLAYRRWIDAVENQGRPSRAAVQEAIAGFSVRPKISIVMPVYNTPRVWLEAAVDSVLAQSYPDWELCLCDDNSSAKHIAPMLDALVAREPRVKRVRRTVNGRISLASNDAMALATGDYMTLMDHDDTIDADSLYEFVRLLNEDPTIDFIYSDEDKITTEDVRYEPFFKPAWSPEYLEACMYTAHLALYRMDLVEKAGPFRDACNGAQDYDFVLRYTEHVRNVRHLPKILYHWRAIPGSTAQAMDAKDYVIAAAIRGLTDRAARTGGADFVRSSPYAGCFELRRPLRERPLVSIVIPSAGRDSEVGGRSVDLLAACVAGIRARSTYDRVEIVVVDNGDLRPATRAALEGAQARSVTWSDPVFNVAAKMNLGARAASGSVLVFLNDDVDVISPDWIEAMLALLQIPGVGAVGPKLLFETGEIQHAGVTFSEGLPDHVRRGYPGNDPGYFFSTVGNRNYLAVTGACLMLRRADFDRVGGFDEGFAVNYNDIDLCLKIGGLGLRVVYCGQASLYHYESRNRVRNVDRHEQERFLERWADTVREDPYYGPWFLARPPTFDLDPSRF